MAAGAHRRCPALSTTGRQVRRSPDERGFGRCGRGLRDGGRVVAGNGGSRLSAEVQAAVQAAVQAEVGDESLRDLVRLAADEAGVQLVGAGAGLRVADPAALLAGGPAAADRAPLILVTGPGDARAVDVAARFAAREIVVLPDGLPWLVQLFGWSISPSAPPGRAGLVAVVGARGGAGATTLCAGLAAAAAGPAVLVDADPAGAGVDLAAGLDQEPGLRWQDLVALRGEVPAVAIRGRLPSSCGVEVLATGPGTPTAASWQAVVASLANAYSTVVLDVPRYRLTATPVPSGTRAVLISTLEIPSLASARSLVDSGRLGPDPVVVIRPVGGPLSMSAAGEWLPDARLIELPASRSLRGAADFGDLTTAVTRGAYGRACREVLRDSGVAAGGGSDTAGGASGQSQGAGSRMSRRRT